MPRLAGSTPVRDTKERMWVRLPPGPAKTDPVVERDEYTLNWSYSLIGKTYRYER